MAPSPAGWLDRAQALAMEQQRNWCGALWCWRKCGGEEARPLNRWGRGRPVGESASLYIAIIILVGGLVEISEYIYCNYGRSVASIIMVYGRYNYS